MVVFSRFSGAILPKLTQIRPLFSSGTAALIAKNAIQARQMSGHKTMYVTPSRFQWHKFKDLLHYYAMLGLIPITAIILYCNIFIGPAQLSEIPEDYTPKHWEYNRHPITRFIARYIHPSPQQEYEKLCHYLYEETEKAKIRGLENKVKQMIAERRDYQAYYYKNVMAKYHRIAQKTAKDLEEIYGDD